MSENTQKTVIIYTGGIGQMTFVEGVNGVRTIAEYIESGLTKICVYFKEDEGDIRARTFIGFPYELRFGQVK